MWNLTYHVMNSTYTNAGGYEASEMYTYVHNTVLPNLKKSGLNITACDLVSSTVYSDILSKTGMDNSSIIGNERFWLMDTYDYENSFFYMGLSGVNHGYNASVSLGVRPSITVVR